MAGDWQVVVGDVTVEAALEKTQGRPGTEAVQFSAEDVEGRRALIASASVVISMLPAIFHLTIAQDCLALGKHLITPSYVSEAMRDLHEEAVSRGLIFMNEVGLDPGIDHMSALQAINHLRENGCRITSFKSHCGGLIAPESDDNPWHYKFTWNPKNVVLAGQGDGGIKYREHGRVRELKYEELFSSATPLHVEGYGQFESYPNRDSLKYLGEYGLEEVETMYRGTLRVPPFCSGWNCLVKLGLTRDRGVSIAELIRNEADILDFLHISKTSEEYLLLSNLDLFGKLGRLETDIVNPARFLLGILEEQWKMKPGDKDLVVMVHEIEYDKEERRRLLQSSLVIQGKDDIRTAMAETVGLPVAMIAKMILNNKIEKRGVLIPKYPEIYNPILAELKQYGISFNERIFDLN